MFLRQGLLKKSPSFEFWSIEHHLALERVERVVDEMREARGHSAHGELLPS